MKLSVQGEAELSSLEKLSDAELVKLVRDGFKARRAKDAAGSGLGARELEESDQPRGQDDPPSTPGTPQPPERNGGALAAGANDHALALEELRIRQSGSANLESDLHLARLRHRPVIAADVAVAEQAIPGYGRLK